MEKIIFGDFRYSTAGIQGVNLSNSLDSGPGFGGYVFLGGHSSQSIETSFILAHLRDKWIHSQSDDLMDFWRSGIRIKLAQSMRFHCVFVKRKLILTFQQS